MALASIEHLFVPGQPDLAYLDPSGSAAIIVDKYPADVDFQFVVAVRTPDAARSGERLAWPYLPDPIRTAANNLCDLLHRHMLEHNFVAPTEVVTAVTSGRSIIEPHRIYTAGGKPESLWTPGRYGDPKRELAPHHMRAIVRKLGFGTVAAEADALFAGVDFSVLGAPAGSK